MAYPDKVVFARELAGLARAELARRVGLSVHHLRAIETGRKSLDSKTLFAISMATGIAPEFFQTRQPIVFLATENSHFRARRSTSQRARLSALRQGAALASFHAACEDSGLEFPEDQVSDFIDGISERFPDPTKLTVQDIENLAVELRTCWGLGIGPLPNVIKLLESRGIAVFELGCEITSTVDAFSASIRHGRPAIFIGNNGSASRSRFTVAHELGHLILHSNTTELEPGHPKLEEQANRFAGAFLMPAASYAASARNKVTAEQLATIKPMWRSSVSAMLMRSYQLGIFPVERRATAYKYMNVVWRKDGESHEPHEPDVERPVALRLAVQVSRESAIEQLARKSGLPLRYIAAKVLPGSQFPSKEPARKRQ